MRTRVLYLAPWVDYGGTDKGTIDWFRALDRDRFEASLITTQPSDNRRIGEVVPHASEVWALPDLVAGETMPRLLFDFVHSRRIDVIHLMNSRLGYDLLPDLGCLPRPPRVVVQLHVEEPDRSGYVRYVTTRYGNLVDSFSVVGEHLAEAVHGYGVPRGKIRVIHLGVDAARELDPGRVRPVDGLEPDLVHVLYPGRLVEQKDPLLMVRVAERLLDVPLAIHVVGEGPLEEEVRRRAPANVRFHPPTRELARWFRACDLLLMTSVFEGIPLVAYEAMAMGVPVVAPVLPGNVEVVAPDGVLIEPRDDVEAYVETLRRLARDEDERRARGESGRERMLREFPLERMAREHERLYEDVIAARPFTDPQPDGGGRPSAEPLAFAARPSFHKRPLVSVVIPCFNHGRFLPACVESVRAQTYPAMEILVVDDGSTDAETIDVLADMEALDGVTVLRLPENRGPSAARNAALELASGRYVLPVDADNELLPDAVERMVDLLATAGEQVGFVYPSIQYFGNRDDWFAAPAYNAYNLLKGNYCDTGSLLDADLIRAGVRFEEEIRLGHEDWDFMLQLAERGVRGEPVRARTVLYRKWGFNRSDAVEYAADLPAEAILRRSPLAAREAELKAEWSPGLSLVALEPIDPASESGTRVAARLAQQSSMDAELVARFDGEWPRAGGPAVRRLPVALAADAAEALQDGRETARGRILAATRGDGSGPLSDRAFVEKVVRVLGDREAPGEELHAIAFCDAPLHSFAPLPRGHDAVPHTVVWRVEAEELLPPVLPLSRDDPIASTARILNACGARMEWRALPADARPEAGSAGGEPLAMPRPAPPADEHQAAERALRLAHRPLLPAMRYETVRRWLSTPTWTRPETIPLCRHRSVDGGHRLFSNDRMPPPGYVLEWDLGRVNAFHLAGTAPLRPDLAVGDGDESLGFVELAAFALLDPLVAGVHRGTRQRVLVCGETDPLWGEIEAPETLGWVEGYPIHPRRRPLEARAFGTTGLLRSVDLGARRHRYALGTFPAGEPVGELGALPLDPLAGTRPVWIADGWLLTDGNAGAGSTRPRPLTAARWTLAPAGWVGFSEPLPKARAIARRAAQVARTLRAGAPRAALPALSGETKPHAHLWKDPGGQRRPLYAAVHPVTGDRLLTPFRDEAIEMGFGEPELLGYLLAHSPVTGTLALERPTVPWASRFGMTARRG